MKIELTQRQSEFVERLLKEEFDKQETQCRKLMEETQIEWAENEEKQDKCMENLSMLAPIICQLNEEE